MSKRKSQLGMNHSTASQRLARDLLYHYAVEVCGHHCHRCGKHMTRDAFSIDHIKPWLDSENPVGLFFKISNVAFSHDHCNKAAARRPNHKGHNTSEYKKQYNAKYYQKNKHKWVQSMNGDAVGS